MVATVLLLSSALSLPLTISWSDPVMGGSYMTWYADGSFSCPDNRTVYPSRAIILSALQTEARSHNRWVGNGTPVLNYGVENQYYQNTSGTWGFWLPKMSFQPSEHLESTCAMSTVSGGGLVVYVDGGDSVSEKGCWHPWLAAYDIPDEWCDPANLPISGNGSGLKGVSREKLIACNDPSGTYVFPFYAIPEAPFAQHADSFTTVVSGAFSMPSYYGGTNPAIPGTLKVTFTVKQAVWFLVDGTGGDCTISPRGRVNEQCRLDGNKYISGADFSNITISWTQNPNSGGTPITVQWPNLPPNFLVWFDGWASTVNHGTMVNKQWAGPIGDDGYFYSFVTMDSNVLIDGLDAYLNSVSWTRPPGFTMLHDLVSQYAILRFGVQVTDESKGDAWEKKDDKAPSASGAGASLVVGKAGDAGGSQSIIDVLLDNETNEADRHDAVLDQLAGIKTSTDDAKTAADSHASSLLAAVQGVGTGTNNIVYGGHLDATNVANAVNNAGTYVGSAANGTTAAVQGLGNNINGLRGDVQGASIAAQNGNGALVGAMTTVANGTNSIDGKMNGLGDKLDGLGDKIDGIGDGLGADANGTGGPGSGDGTGGMQHSAPQEGDYEGLVQDQKDQWQTFFETLDGDGSFSEAASGLFASSTLDGIVTDIVNQDPWEDFYVTLPTFGMASKGNKGNLGPLEISMEQFNIEPPAAMTPIFIMIRSIVGFVFGFRCVVACVWLLQGTATGIKSASQSKGA